MMQKWQKTDQTEQKVGFRTIIEKSFVMPDGSKGSFTTQNKIGARNAGVVALTSDNRVVISRQFRPGPEVIFEEIPGGIVEDGEEIEAAAARELREETGYATDEPLVFLGQAVNDCYNNATNNYFLARNCSKVADQSLDEHEFVEVDVIPIGQLIDNAKSKKMSDPAAVLMAYDTLMELEHA